MTRPVICRSGVAYPVHYGCAVDVASGEVFPAGFDDQARTHLNLSGNVLVLGNLLSPEIQTLSIMFQGPDRVLRHARTSFNRRSPRDFHEIYSCGRIAIQPFPFAYYPGMHIVGLVQ